MTRGLVTGGAGFVGSHVVDALVALGEEVRILDALHPAAHAARPDYIHPAAEFVLGDVRDGARANVRGLTAPEPVPGAFNVASGTPFATATLRAPT